MSLRMQALLLRFLESGEIQRVGAERAQARVNVRVIAGSVNGTGGPVWDNIADPDYARHATLLAEAMLKRYANHPAIIAIGYDNEIVVLSPVRPDGALQTLFRPADPPSPVKKRATSESHRAKTTKPALCSLLVTRWNWQDWT